MSRTKVNRDVAYFEGDPWVEILPADVAIADAALKDPRLGRLTSWFLRRYGQRVLVIYIALSRRRAEDGARTLTAESRSSAQQ